MKLFLKIIIAFITTSIVLGLFVCLLIVGMIASSGEGSLLVGTFFVLGLLFLTLLLAYYSFRFVNKKYNNQLTSAIEKVSFCLYLAIIVVLLVIVTKYLYKVYQDDKRRAVTCAKVGEKEFENGKFSCCANLRTSEDGTCSYLCAIEKEKTTKNYKPDCCSGLVLGSDGICKKK